MKVPKPLMPPVDVQTSCDLVTWRRPPNTSLHEVDGYHLRFTSSGMHMNEGAEIIVHVNPFATFDSLTELNHVTNKEMVAVQVTNILVNFYNTC